MVALKKEVNDEVYFWHADKHGSFLQVNTIVLGVCSQACPKYPPPPKKKKKFAYLCNILRKMWGMGGGGEVDFLPADKH